MRTQPLSSSAGTTGVGRRLPRARQNHLRQPSEGESAKGHRTAQRPISALSPIYPRVMIRCDPEEDGDGESVVCIMKAGLSSLALGAVFIAFASPARRMSVENLLWGAPRIHGEVLKLGFAVA